MTWLRLALQILLPAVGCLHPDPWMIGQNPMCPLKKQFVPFKALTFNAILHDNAWTKNNLNIPNNRVDRRTALIDYLKNTDAEVICLQEVFIGEDVEAIVNGLSGQYQYSQSQLHLYNGILPPQSTGLRAPVCDLNAVNDLNNCAAIAGCVIANGGSELVACLRAKCLQEIQQAILLGGTKCLSCILAAELTNVVTKCVSPTPAVGLWDMNTMGLLLLSKRSLTNRLAVPIYQNIEMTLNKGYLQATINDEVTVACTHLTSSDLFSIEPVLSQFIPTADAQNDFEVDDVVRRFKDVEPLLLLGDFNLGPSGQNLQPVKEDRYQRLVNEFNTEAVMECTFCRDNPYNNGDTTDVDVAIDHIFENGVLRISDPKVVLKVNDASVITNGVVLPVSDHYGVEAMVACQCDSTVAQHPRSNKQRYYRGQRRKGPRHYRLQY